MDSKEFPLILSPNLGYPKIISIEEIKYGKTISLIIAGQYREFTFPLKDAFEGTLYLRPSYSEDEEIEEIPLYITQDPEKITDWNLLSGFSKIDDTRKLINSELHYNVLGEDTSYWRVDVTVMMDGNGDYKTLLLREKDGKYLPKLFDLILRPRSGKWEKVNYHSIQIVESIQNGCNFIHLTDLHTAKRNDEILDEVLKVKNQRSREDIERHYINFNDKLREFIYIANDMADRGELDFVVITGDLVDFAFPGWEDEPNVAENNWKTLIKILTGSGNEGSVNFRVKKRGIEGFKIMKGNPGIKVAVFTSTGNHDWRLHPYDPNLGSYNESFGLRKEELENYKYKSFDSTEYPEDKRAKLAREITSEAFKKFNLHAFADKEKIRLAKFLSSNITTWALRLMAGVGLGSVGMAGYMKAFIYIVILGLIGAGVWGIKKLLDWKTQRLVDLIIDNPLHAEAKAIHYYLKHINPYLDYAFHYGKHYFIVMDTGADVFIGQLLDGKEIGDIKRMSIQDNILGGSPDSRAFDSEQTYYNWSQIVWLEKVLAAISQGMNVPSSTFIFLHAPPINPPADDNFDWSKLWEQNRKEPKWIPKDECNLTYGTINHYLSQFFYLCMGYRESELVKKVIKGQLKKVDLVLSGHAHRNIEFRIEKEWVEKDKKHEIRIYSDVYSQLLDAGNPDKWWEEHKPAVVQTASCGLQGRTDRDPPYFRKVTIDGKGQITDFRVMTNGGFIKF